MPLCSILQNWAQEKDPLNKIGSTYEFMFSQWTISDFSPPNNDSNNKFTDYFPPLTITLSGGENQESFLLAPALTN